VEVGDYLLIFSPCLVRCFDAAAKFVATALRMRKRGKRQHYGDLFAKLRKVCSSNMSFFATAVTLRMEDER